MASSTNINGFNIGGNNNSFDQRGHFYRAFLSGNVSGMTVKQNSTPNMTVLVEHGSALLNKNTISASVAEIKSDTSVTIDTANTANPRIDSVVIYEDTSVAIPTVEANYWQDGAGGRFKIVSLPGTAASPATALTDANIQSAIGAGKPWARLADITVIANSSTILNSNINNSVRNKLGVSLSNLNGGTTAGTLTTDASGNVTAAAPGYASTVWSNGSGNYSTGGSTTPIVIDATNGKATATLRSGSLVRIDLHITGIYNQNISYEVVFDVGIGGATLRSSSGAVGCSPSGYGANWSTDGSSKVTFTGTFYFTNVGSGAKTFYALFATSSAAYAGYVSQFAKCQIAVTEVA